MVPYTGSFQQVVKVDGVIYVNQTVTVTADGNDGRLIEITGPATNLEIAFTLALAASKLFSINCTVDATVKTNDATTPAKTLTLKANDPVSWKTGDPPANHPLGTVDVTKLFLTTAATGALTLTIVSLKDATP
jgi:hypothetical protein